MASWPLGHDADAAVVPARRQVPRLAHRVVGALPGGVRGQIHLEESRPTLCTRERVVTSAVPLSATAIDWGRSGGSARARRDRDAADLPAPRQVDDGDVLRPRVDHVEHRAIGGQGEARWLRSPRGWEASNVRVARDTTSIWLRVGFEA